MIFLLALALWLFRMTGFLTEPMLTSDEIHAVAGEPSRAVWTLAPDHALRMVTWNIERGVRFEAVRSVLEELDADVVLLQEVDRLTSPITIRSLRRPFCNDVSDGACAERAHRIVTSARACTAVKPSN
jgi:endonuclease/exonuclease/phosphatase (EEP) superfamily protein YafD